jgi:uncharacterized membrane protein YhaH (DUF805 family)
MNYYIDVLKRWQDFSSRSPRKEYWMFVLYNLLISIAISIVGAILFRDGFKNILSGLYGLFTLIPSLAVGVRRLHDTGRSAWWLLIALIPLLGSLVLLIFMVLDSQSGSNKYGPNPKGQ